jgi:hypothetical protein
MPLEFKCSKQTIGTTFSMTGIELLASHGNRKVGLYERIVTVINLIRDAATI